MVDTKTISKNIIIELRRRIFGKSDYGNKDWGKADNEWYSQIHDSNYLLHQDFERYLTAKKDIKTILEVGCGTGIYPIKKRKLFEGKHYTGIDFSKKNIDYCKQNSDFEFLQGDFIKMKIPAKYDLVFSHAVIDHVYDINKFLLKIVESCKKYAYINSYRGFLPNLQKHKMRWDDTDHCYYNDISVKKVKQLLLNNGLQLEEITIRGQESGQKGKNVNLQLVIEIKKII